MFNAEAGLHELPVLMTHGRLLSFTRARIGGPTGVERWRAMTAPDVSLLESHAALFRAEGLRRPGSPDTT